MNAMAIGLNLFLPWILFCAVFAVMSSTLHFEWPRLAYSILGAGVVADVIAIVLALRNRKRVEGGVTVKEPSWFLFAAVALTLALISAFVFGDMNYFYNTMIFHDLENLNTYPDIDPSKHKGEEIMDAGRIFFTEGSKLDFEKGMSFKNLDVYCVAPVVNEGKKHATYDFWAVGVNCCSGIQSHFRCGEFGNEHARAGLRLMRDEQRPYFRLAVQQAEATYNIKAEHPLFFEWMQDPNAEVSSYRHEGLKWYLLGIGTHFVFNAFCVVCAIVGFSKIGRY